MGPLFFIALFGFAVAHGFHTYAQHKSVDMAIESGLEYALSMYLVTIGIIVAFVLLATHFGWFA